MKKLLRAFKETNFFQTIKSEIVLGKFFHANLFSCEDETTNLEFSKLVAMSLVCEKNEACGGCSQCVKVLAETHPDIAIFGVEKRFLVQDAEKIMEDAYVVPMISDKKIIIIHSFDKSTPQAMNKILKILEEPPRNVYFVLNATNLNLVLPTIRSRCVSRRIPPFDDLHIRQICEDEFEKEMTKAHVCASGGYYGNAERLMQNEDFEKAYVLGLETFTKLKSSKDVLGFSSRFADNKQAFTLKLSLLLSFARDILMILQGREDLATNTMETNLLKSIAKEFTTEAISDIIVKIDMAKKQSEANVSQNLIADKLLLSILEVKYLCKQR